MTWGKFPMEAVDRHLDQNDIHLVLVFCCSIAQESYRQKLTIFLYQNQH